MHAQGETLTRALLLQDGLMLLVVTLGFAVARGLPARLPVVAADP
jgi:hypothetical protein